MGGKQDWVAAGLALEGDQGGVAPLLAAAHTGGDVPVCELSEPARTVRDRIDSSELDFALATNQADVVLGKARRRDLGGRGGRAVADLLVEGPTTVRADEDLTELTERMRRAGTGSVVVTSDQGELVGVLTLEAAEATVDESRNVDRT